MTDEPITNADEMPRPTAVDCHIHWFPVDYYRMLADRRDEPRAEHSDGRWSYLNGNRTVRAMDPEWFDLDAQFRTAARTGYEMTLVCSLGIHSDLDGLPAAEAREAARLINEAWADAQRRHPGRFFAAAAVSLADTEMAIAELDHAVEHLGLRGVSIPGSIAGEPIDAPRLDPFYARVAQLGVPMLIHPNDGAFVDVMSGYNNRLYASLGRVVDSSVAVLRLILSGTLDRHPDLRILHFHAGGVLPYAAGRLDKNARLPELEQAPSAYLKRMWVDTAMPHPLTIRMARDFYGSDRVFYGSDNPCWNPTAALEAVMALELSAKERNELMDANVRRLIRLEPAAVAA
ncbi:MAG TPA: amidohydrolase family protein [Solirubrobacteraceae bacterium]|nr:amidohydrolase family protein [Solirubrobacteraceae bacterium]